MQIPENYNPVRTIRELPLFSELPVEVLRQITEFCRNIRFSKGEVIFYEGESFNGFYIVLKGLVKIYKTSAAGSETVLHLVAPFESFAEVPLFQGQQVYPASAQVLEDSKLLFIPAAPFLKFLEENPKACLKIITGFSHKLRILTARVEDLTTRDVHNRLAMFLLANAEQSDISGTMKIVRLTFQKTDLAGYLGTITETLSRTFNRLQKEGIIRVTGKTIEILDESHLKKLAELKK
ncbi:MAG: Crp/Fnr family transcriptional regulator [Ignavibacteria bacterium]|nr:Crp/Fnr family transcriptional regulator [Ignavibacteria bacterium]